MSRNGAKLARIERYANSDASRGAIPPMRAISPSRRRDNDNDCASARLWPPSEIAAKADATLSDEAALDVEDTCVGLWKYMYMADIICLNHFYNLMFAALNRADFKDIYVHPRAGNFIKNSSK